MSVATSPLSKKNYVLDDRVRAEHISLSTRLPPRARRDYWEQLQPASGRPLCPSMSTPEGWGVTKGHEDLLQHKEATSSQEMKHVVELQKKAKSS